MLNWIVWNRTNYLNKDGFGVNYLTKVDMLQNPTNQPTNRFNVKSSSISNNSV